MLVVQMLTLEVPQVVIRLGTACTKNDKKGFRTNCQWKS